MCCWGRLQVEVLARNGIDWQCQATSPDAVAGCRWFPETQHNVCDQQAGNGHNGAWSQHGLEFDGQRGTSYAESLALFGVPVTEAYQATVDGQMVQVMWFERARFEWHPNNPEAYRVLFGRLGAEIQGAPLSAPLPRKPAAAHRAAAGHDLAAKHIWHDRPAPNRRQRRPRDAGLHQRWAGRRQHRLQRLHRLPHTATAEQLTFGQLISTLRACADPLGGQEREVLAAPQAAARTSADRRHAPDRLQPGSVAAATYKAVPATTATVTGTVTYLSVSPLPPSATVTVQLLDTSRQDVAATVLAEQVITANGLQVPFPFTLTYDPAKIDLSGTYSVRAEIRNEGSCCSPPPTPTW